MKVKLDFVTNSSSTSVVMWGTYLDGSQIQENETLIAKIKELAGKEDITEDIEEEGLVYMIDDVLSGFGLDTHGDYDGSGIYIGKSPFSMKEDETLKQFKENIESKLKELGINNKIESIVESWMDG
jgi:hypothetical protein